MSVKRSNQICGLAMPLGVITAFATFAALGGCATPRVAPLEAGQDRIELERFMGDWYVVGSIPITLPGLSEEGSHNGKESYELADDGTILTTYTFREGGFDGPEKRFEPKGWVHNTETNTEWRMQFVWPFKAVYLIAWVDKDYQQTIIGVPNRKFIWLMSREPNISDENYERLLDRCADLGYDRSSIRRVPQRWAQQ